MLRKALGWGRPRRWGAPPGKLFTRLGHRWSDSKIDVSLPVLLQADGARRAQRAPMRGMRRPVPGPHQETLPGERDRRGELLVAESLAGGGAAVSVGHHHPGSGSGQFVWAGCPPMRGHARLSLSLLRPFTFFPTQKPICYVIICTG